MERSVLTGEKCCCGRAWYELGIGTGNPKFTEKYGHDLPTVIIRGDIYVDISLDPDEVKKKYDIPYCDFLETDIWKKVDFPYFHDKFRIANYPSKIIHSRRDLRRFLKKKIF